MKSGFWVFYVLAGLLQLGIVVQFTSDPDLMRATDLGIVTE